MRGDGDSPRRAVLHLAWLIVLGSAFLAPVLGTGYWAEDLYQSMSPRASTVLNGSTYAEVIFDHVVHTLRLGRFFPLTGMLIPAVHAAFAEVWQYKAFLVGASLLDLTLFYALARTLTGRRDFAAFSSCLAVGLMQFRATIDPFIGNVGMVQILVALLFGSLLALQRHLDRPGGGPRSWWLLGSVSAYLACALLYEVSYVLVPLHLLLIARAGVGVRRFARTASPFLGVVGVCGALSVLLRRLYPSEMYWHHTDFAPLDVLRAVAYQTSAALPMSYFLADPIDLFPSPTGAAMLRWLLDARVVLVGSAAFGLCLICARRPGGAGAPGPIGRADRRWLVALGAILAVFPSLLLAISPHHRATMAPGVGWIPVLIQIFGVALAGSAILWALIESPAGGGPGARWKALLASMLVASTVGITYRANEEVARCFLAAPGTERFRTEVGVAGGGHHHPRLLLEAALRAGLLDEVPEHATVERTRDYPFWYDATYAPLFFASYAGKPVDSPGPSSPPVPTPAPADSYRVRDMHTWRGFGAVLLSRRTGGGEPGGDPAEDRALRLYVRHPSIDRVGPADAFHLEGADPEGREPGAPVDAEDLPVLRSGPGWVLLSLGPMGGVLPADSLRVVFDRPRDPALARGPSGGSPPARLH
ncbi:hypothetical protein ElP_38910 [Tautonia plasticadhaerens]|uniref:Glycosyltransferase RgtA/B/C/D-like domain-containing protein n=2 Tax=Tautonia plasticadhaerens TaxID=2527974 RepID=A0A518H568_9BACT|nr:hypothetical protein ElP_38910 [Tautonia plasticadhaerens]